MTADDKYLTKNDLALLMESYQNMFLMHKNILDQQSDMSDDLKKIIDTQNEIVKGQSTDLNEIGKIVNTLDSLSSKLEKTYDSLDTTEGKLIEKIDQHNVELVKFAGSITNKVYLAWVGSATVILGLIGLFLKLS
ncbi:MAG: hypothetical protein GOV02_03075 [Candidatus Aenigmarchaeota archaeon]|nr:hypothetical protein [Candidatus Aenigmarchaeota archaeon]